MSCGKRWHRALTRDSFFDSQQRAELCPNEYRSGFPDKTSLKPFVLREEHFF